MTQEEMIVWEMEKRGGRITTNELLTLPIAQYQARLKGLRDKGYVSPARPIPDNPKNFYYELIQKPPVKSPSRQTGKRRTTPSEGPPRQQGEFFQLPADPWR